MEKSANHVEHMEDLSYSEIVHTKAALEHDTIEDTTPGAFVWICAAATAIGGMLFGYDTGVISGVLVVIGSDLDNKPLTDSEKELITTLVAAGAFVGAIIAGICADKFGRKPAIWFAAVLFTIGAIIQAASYTIIQMSFGRFLIGLGVGSASMVNIAAGGLRLTPD
jgi:SP family myo-inositol transporter-like MFS transporter 13